MLSLTVPLNRVTSCRLVPMCSLSWLILMSLTSTPSIVTRPEDTS